MTFSLDPTLARALTESADFDVLVETGTYRGDTVDVMRTLVPSVVSVEADGELARKAAARFRDCGDVQILAGDSGDRLRELSDDLSGKSVFYWLDAHWCAGEGTSIGSGDPCPLLRELSAIGCLNDRSVILIDDARLFLAPPSTTQPATGWPTFDQVLAALVGLSASHRLVVINDVLIFHADALAGVVQQYGREHGVDWLSVADRARDYADLLEDNLAKEGVIRELASALTESQNAAASRANGTLARVAAARARITLAKGRAVTHPLSLFQYPARPMRLPSAYVSKGVGSASLPVISIALPSLNQRPYLGESIASVANQRYPATELVVQDGGSTDGSTDVIKAHRPVITAAVSEPDSGQADAINKAFSRTSGSIMGWLNSDDLLLPGALNLIGRYFASHPDVDVVYGWRKVIDAAGLEVGRWMVPANTHEYLDWADYVPQETLYWRRSLWDRVGGALDTSFQFAIDWELLQRFTDAGARFARLPHYLGAFRVHSTSKTVRQLTDMGAEDMDRLRRRRHGRAVSTSQVGQALLPLYRAAWLSRVQGGRSA